MGRAGRIRVVYWRAGWCGRRVCRWVSSRAVSYLRVLTSTKSFHYTWKPFAGWRVVAVAARGDYTDQSLKTFPPLQEKTMKRRIPAVNSEAPPNPAPKTSVMWGKLPAIRDFLTATAYDDGTLRTPGYMTIKVIGIAWQVTLYDPDSGARLPVRGVDLDTTLATAEQLLGVEDASWEIDRYLSEMLAKRGKRKRS